MKTLLKFWNSSIRTTGNTDSHPYVPENLHMVNRNYIAQSAPNIGRKTQWVKVENGMNTLQLGKLAYKVYNVNEEQKSKSIHVLFAAPR
jgi:hypothetical protein